MPISATPDHVAIAVPDIDDALARWRDTLGGAVAWRFHNPTLFRGAAVLFRGGAYLEMLMPSDAERRTGSIGGPDGFLEAYLDRHGAGVHHVTLKVPDLHGAVATLAADGLEAVDVDDSVDHWHEAFLRPSQVGGLVVQVAATDETPADLAAASGAELPPTPATGGRLLGPHLVHPDLERAATVWSALGGDVARRADGLLVSWPDAPMTVAVSAGDHAGVRGLRFTGAVPRPADPVLGPAVLATPDRDA